MLDAPVLFGLGQNNNSFCPVDAINITQESTPSEAQVNSSDIVIISYPATPGALASSILMNFINNNGVVIQCVENTGNLILPNAIFEQTISLHTPTLISLPSNSEYIILSSGSSPLTNGAYENIAGKNIGYDGGYNIAFNMSNMSNVEIVGVRSSNSAAPVIIRHKSKPYIVCGDAGIFAGRENPTSATNQPLNVTSKGLPAVRTGTNYPPVYNAHLFANIMIWAINYRLTVAP
jgi:hypothetical protein